MGICGIVYVSVCVQSGLFVELLISCVCVCVCELFKNWFIPDY